VGDPPSQVMSSEFPVSAAKAAGTEMQRNTWPAFVYIGLMISFSICFFLQRRAEVEAIRKAAAGLEHRIERVERLLKGLPR
jgi:hypothetical protein